MTSRRELNDFPTHIGRYRVTGQIAEGSFAAVLRARDEDLDRDVAIKVPHAHLHLSDQALQTFLAEARILASLDHPGIVPVYDVGCTEDGLCFLVTKLIEGTDLKTRLKRSCLRPREAIEIVASVAEALHCAHRRGLVHRDVKPANILLDEAGRPLLIDFGLALKEDELGSGPMNVGTPLYMSPEQARHKGHQVDARTDVYSLGVVFYEMLTGRTPFRANTMEELMDMICNHEARPPRQIDDTIPLELERIWQKATARQVVDRYSTAKDLAEELRAWGNNCPARAGPSVQGRAADASQDPSRAMESTLLESGRQGTRARRRVPRWATRVLALVAVLLSLAVPGWYISRWLFPLPMYPHVRAVEPQSLFDGLTLAPPDWIISDGSWAAAEDTEGARVLSGRGIIRRRLPTLPDFRLLLGVNLHQAESAEIQFGIQRDDGPSADRYALHFAIDTGVQLGRRAGDRGPFEPLADSLPLMTARNATQYREVRIERFGGRWWVFFDDRLVDSIVDDGPVLNEFRLVAEGGTAWFSELEASRLLPSS